MGVGGSHATWPFAMWLANHSSRDGYRDIVCNLREGGEKSTDSVEGAAAQESIDSLEGEGVHHFSQTTNNPLSSFVKRMFRFFSEWHFSQQSSPAPNPLLLCTPIYSVQPLAWFTQKEESSVASAMLSSEVNSPVVHGNSQ